MFSKNKNLVGQSEAEEAFLRSFKNNRLHHAWLICGDKGIGKATLAYKIAKFMLSDPVIEKTSNLDIGMNLPSSLKVDNQSHPDLFILESEKEKDGELVKDDIKVDEVRELTKFLSLTSALSKNKIVIIDSINDLNVNAANALLKFLEEPFDKTYYLLVCHSVNAILPTVRSRCRMLKLKKLCFDDFYDVLSSRNKINRNSALKLYEITGGSLYYAEILLHPKINKLLKHLEVCSKDKIPLKELLKISRGLSNDFEFEAFKYLIINLIQKQIKENIGTYEVENEFEKLDNIKELLYSCENFNLDRTYVIQNTLDILQR